MNAETRKRLEEWLEREENKASALCLNDVDREFFRQCGIAVEDAAWPLEENDEKLTYDEALAVLDRSMKRKRQETIGCFEILNPSVDPEAGVL